MNYKKFLFVFLLGICIFSTDTIAAPATNLVVDFDSTDIDSSLSPGDSGVLNLVIKNTGGYSANDVSVIIPTTGVISADKSFDIGQMSAGETKTLPVVIRISKNAKTGLSAVNVRLNYDGYDTSGNPVTNKITTWDVPVRIYGTPSFQIKPERTTYYKDTLDKLVLEGTLISDVNELQSHLSSSCLTVMGSSKTRIGDVIAANGFQVDYTIKPTTEGACMASLLLEYTDEGGSSVTNNISFGLNIGDAGVDFKIINISYGETGPGETVDLQVVLKNVGRADAEETTVILGLEDPFVPVDSEEKFVGPALAGQSVQANFGINIGWQAQITAYSIPMTISYKVGGTSYSVEKDIGLDVTGQVLLEIIDVTQSRGTIQIEVANIGTRSAEGLKGELIFSDQNRTRQARAPTNISQGETNQQRPTQVGNPMAALTGGNRRTGGFAGSQIGSGGSVNQGDQLIDYKSDIKPTKYTSFTFTTSETGPAMFRLEYTGPNNKRVVQTEMINAGSTGMSSGTFMLNPANKNISGNSSSKNSLYYALAILIVGIVAYKLYKRRKSRS